MPKKAFLIIQAPTELFKLFERNASENECFGSALLTLCHRFGVNFAGLLALGFSLRQLEEGSYHAQTLYKPLIPLLT